MNPQNTSGARCNRTSVGIIVTATDNGDVRVAMGDRVKPPACTAAFAGHVEPSDGLGSGDLHHPAHEAAFRRAAARELLEESGIAVDPAELRLVVGAVYAGNPAWGSGGCAPEHLWRVYEINFREAPALRAVARENRNLRWMTPDEIGDAGQAVEPVWRDHLAYAHILPAPEKWATYQGEPLLDRGSPA